MKRQKPFFTTDYLYVVQGEPRDWIDEDVAFIGEVAELTWAASGRARADAALRRAEETERLLIREIDHRAKNVLAVVQSLAHLTPFENKKQYVTALSGRIGSLARSHSLLSSNRWSGARLDVLLQQELEPYGAENDSRLVIDGPPVLIQAEAAQSLGLVIHELATNASKYGALSISSGALEVDWRWEPGRRLVLTWRETGGPVVRPPRRQGFGAILIANAGRQVGATIQQEWRAEGLVCRITLDRGATPYFGKPPKAVEPPGPENARVLRDQRVLIVEDEALVAMELTQILVAAGAQVVGPAGDIEHALRLVEAGGIDRALLDVNLAGRMVTPVASALSLKSIPFVYLTGYQEPNVEGGPVLHKPANRRGAARGASGADGALEQAARHRNRTTCSRFLFRIVFCGKTGVHFSARCFSPAQSPPVRSGNAGPRGPRSRSPRCRDRSGRRDAHRRRGPVRSPSAPAASRIARRRRASPRHRAARCWPGDPRP